MGLFNINAAPGVDHVFVVKKKDLNKLTESEIPMTKEALDEAKIPYVQGCRIGKEYHIFT